ncbi:hypothetical protein DNH61_02555 [Paenibacillus sambharensis]|uniref:Uncharacterized protein n=1 Tax=Paenibacillus sambharensis TaxID=1803190 RepID=A0A2W1LGR9_9BACL|nr:hypothetical protein [Paenibacillus sambharensis]PZD97260.1 hypothetical protein DNH61_02555 [Paenibacillus sambharensis]
MLIEINQTKSNLEQIFEILTNGELTHLGRTSWIGTVFSTKLLSADESLIFETRFRPLEELINMVPRSRREGTNR